MKFGTNYEQGEILLVPFPFSNLSSLKKRPVVILSKSSDSDYSLLIDNNFNNVEFVKKEMLLS